MRKDATQFDFACARGLPGDPALSSLGIRLDYGYLNTVHLDIELGHGGAENLWQFQLYGPIDVHLFATGNVGTDRFSLPLDGFEVRGDIARATEPFTLSDGSVIEKGTMAAQRITVAGLRNGNPFLTFRAHWFCTPHLDPDWNINGEGWLFTTKGDAPMQVRVTYGRTDEGYSEHLAGYTAHPAVNAIPYVVEAKPGIRTIFGVRITSTSSRLEKSTAGRTVICR